MRRRLAVLAVVALLAAGAHASPRERYGMMGKILGYDAEKQVVQVKVVETRIPDVFNSVLIPSEPLS